MEKHLPYFNLLESFSKEECPLCRRITSTIDRFFTDLLYEGVNDVEFRAHFNARGVFCNMHAYTFAKYHDGLAVCLLYQEPLRVNIESLHKENGRGKTRPSVRECPVCERIREIERLNLETIVQFLSDEDLKRSFYTNEVLCMPHFSMVRADRKTLPDWFVEVHKKQYSELLQGLRRYLESCNFSLGTKRPVLTRGEELVYQRVIKTLYGYKGNITGGV